MNTQDGGGPARPPWMDEALAATLDAAVGRAIEDGISAALARARAGHRDDAAVMFDAAWDTALAAGDALHACVAAHFAAYCYDDVLVRLGWHLRALEQAQRVTGLPQVLALAPALHANLADTFLRLGDLRAARHHLRLGLSSRDQLEAGPYARSICALLQRTADLLQGIDSGRLVAPGRRVPAPPSAPRGALARWRQSLLGGAPAGPGAPVGGPGTVPGPRDGTAGQGHMTAV